MHLERVNQIQIDIRKLNLYLDELLTSEPYQQSEYLAGWPILNARGDKTGGLQSWFHCLNVDGTFNRQKALGIGYRHEFEHENLTPFAFGYMGEVIEQIIRLGLQPRRARVTLIKAGKSLPWHTDAPPENYLVRLHIPIRTNLNCTVRFADGEYHLPADGGAWIFPVNQFHEVRNDGDTDRYHLIMSVYDTKGLTRSNRCSEEQMKKIINDMNWLNREIALARNG